MTQPSIFDAPVPTMKKSRTELVADYFRARPGQWIDGLVFAQFAGAYAWRSRLADARREFGMVIENRQRHLPGGVVQSEYRFVPR